MIDVTARLHPDTQSTVTVQDHAARRNNEGRGREVVLVLVLRKGITRPRQPVERHVNGDLLARIDRRDALNLRPQILNVHCVSSNLRTDAGTGICPRPWPR